MTDGERSQKPKLSCDFYGGGVNVCREARGRSWDFDELIGEPMSASGIRHPIAERHLQLTNGGHVDVLIWAPERIADDEFRCAYQIQGMTVARESHAIGADGIQALMLAFEKIGVELYTSDDAKSGALRLDGELDLGFPVPKGLSDLLPKVGS